MSLKIKRESLDQSKLKLNLSKSKQNSIGVNNDTSQRSNTPDNIIKSQVNMINQ